MILKKISLSLFFLWVWSSMFACQLSQEQINQLYSPRMAYESCPLYVGIPGDVIFPSKKMNVSGFKMKIYFCVIIFG